MSKKKKFILNCDVCDARKIKEESLSEYEQIIINADLILVDEYSRDVFHRLPIMCNADEMLDEENRAAFLQMKEVLLPEIEIVQMYYVNQLANGTIYNYDKELRPKAFQEKSHLSVAGGNP